MCSGFPGSRLFVWYIPQMLDWTEMRGIWRSIHNDKFFVVPLKAFLNHFSTRQGALFCWNRQQPSGNTASLKGWTCSASASRLVRGYSGQASMSLSPPPNEPFDIGNSSVLGPPLIVTTAEQEHPTKAAVLTQARSSCHHSLALVTHPLKSSHLPLFFLLPTHQH